MYVTQTAKSWMMLTKEFAVLARADVGEGGGFCALRCCGGGRGDSEIPAPYTEHCGAHTVLIEREEVERWDTWLQLLIYCSMESMTVVKSL
jgi:hypothetical protein